jgi:hypothetical protein
MEYTKVLSLITFFQSDPLSKSYNHLRYFGTPYLKAPANSIKKRAYSRVHNFNLGFFITAKKYQNF